MATAAFKSTSKRSTIGGRGTGDSRNSGSRNSNSDLANAATHRRSRSVSRYSHRLPVAMMDSEQTPAQASRSRGKFLNTISGSEFQDISLDDLAIELFSSGDFGTSDMEAGIRAEQRRGRSASRKEGRVGELTGDESLRVGRSSGNGIGRLASDATSRGRRPLSEARYQASDSETNGHSSTHTIRANSKNVTGRSEQTLQKLAAYSQQRGFQRCASQKDMFKPYDDYSSYSSLTDDEARDTWYHSDGIEKALRSRQTKAEDCSMRDELRYAVDKTRLGLEQSEKRKQELLAEIILEEQRGKELQKIAGGLLPDPKETARVKRTSRAGKRSNNRRRISKLPEEDADKIIEDFISSVEDTDISSFDGERSDTSSLFGMAAAKPKDVLMQFGNTESFRSAASARSDFLPVAKDGVVLPWLEWETSNDGSLPCRDGTQVSATVNSVFQDALEDVSMVGKQVQSGAHSTSSCGSWSPGLLESFSIESFNMEPDSRNSSQLSLNVPRKPVTDIGYFKTSSSEDCLVERWKHREQISSGMLLICHNSFGSVLI